MKRMALSGRLTVGIIIGGLVIGMMLGWYGLHQIPFQRLTFSGLHYLSVEEMINQVHVDSSKTLFEQDLERVLEGVRKHPWVEQVSTTRWITGTLEVTVKERTPVALVLDGQGRPVAYLDAEGYAMPWRWGVDAVVPLVRGVSVPGGRKPVDSSVLRKFLALLQKPEVRHFVTEVKILTSGDLEILTIPTPYQSGIPVVLGKDEFERKWKRLKAFWEQAALKPPARIFKRVDLRFNRQIVTEEIPLKAVSQ